MQHPVLIYYVIYDFFTSLVISVLFSVKVWGLVIMGGSSSWSFDDGNTFEKDDPQAQHCCGDKSQQNFGRNMIMATGNHFSNNFSSLEVL